jgi:hypothetical protein
MKRFEENIRKERKVFEHREPEKDHLARFILKLEKDQEKHLRKKTPWYYTRAAAAVIILVAASYVTYDFISQRSAEPVVQKITYASDLSEIMAYYDAVSMEKMSEIEGLSANSDNAEKLKQMAYNRIEDMDIRLAAIEKEYMKNPDNEMLKAALINNKRKKAEVMEHILLQIDFANSQLY